jgi:hypothetical protein
LKTRDGKPSQRRNEFGACWQARLRLIRHFQGEGTYPCQERLENSSATDDAVNDAVTGARGIVVIETMMITSRFLCRLGTRAHWPALSANEIIGTATGAVKAVSTTKMR